ncbi:hypothetical protein ACJVDH_10915 [Pedobacter sp. AW1-32]|uniref:hypothetical protein n=1 Tax=Pedobacter sp. AW1-32 TaxID=3383026 RepID=UPI003FF1436A
MNTEKDKNEEGTEAKRKLVSGLVDEKDLKGSDADVDADTENPAEEEKKEPQQKKD